MALVGDIIRDALTDIGVLAAGETPRAEDQQLALRYLQRQIDSWAAQRLTLSEQLATVFTLTSGTVAVTLGASGATVTMDRPMWLNAVNYIIPGSNPAVESPIGMMDEDAYSAITIKNLSSALPMQVYYQTELTSAVGTLNFWPRVSQNVQIVIYTPQAVGVPTSVNSVLIGPPGYAEAFLYQLAMRLCMPFGVAPSDLVVENEKRATMTMKRPNVQPGIMGIDAALVSFAGGGYNILSDTQSSR